MFAGVDGYGHGDIGRETLDKVYARLFGAEAALVSDFVLLSTLAAVAVVIAAFGCVGDTRGGVGVRGLPVGSGQQSVRFASDLRR